MLLELDSYDMSDIVEEIESREGENQINQVLSKIGRGGSEDNLLREFANLAVTFGWKEWAQAYRQIQTRASAASLKNLSQALKIVRMSGYAGSDLPVDLRGSLKGALKGFKVR
jgi:hypothetical protein